MKKPELQIKSPSDERLVLLMEEASEVIKCASKCLRFGGEENYMMLSEELGDFLYIMQLMTNNREIYDEIVQYSIDSKPIRMEPYTNQTDYSAYNIDRN